MLQKVLVQAFDPAAKFSIDEVLADMTIVEPLVAAFGKIQFASVYAESNVPHRGIFFV